MLNTLALEAQTLIANAELMWQLGNLSQMRKSVCGALELCEKTEDSNTDARVSADYAVFTDVLIRSSIILLMLGDVMRAHDVNQRAYARAEIPQCPSQSQSLEARAVWHNRWIYLGAGVAWRLFTLPTKMFVWGQD